MSETGSKYILAIDLGTSGPKVALADERGTILASAFRPNDVALLDDGGAEQDPEQWWRSICDAAHEVLALGLAPVERIAAVCCTTQWSGTVAVDRDGRHLMPALIWLDSRGAPLVREITRGLINFEGYAVSKLWRWIRLTGGIPGHSGKDPLAHILYIQKHHPAIDAATYKYLEPKDYLNLRLTGKFAAGYDSIALHWVTDNRDLTSVSYDARLMKMSRLDRDKLPDLLRASDILGTLTQQAAADLGLTTAAQVVMGTPDLQSAAIGAGAVRDFEGDLYVGTSSWINCHVPFKKTDALHSMTSLPSAIPGRYLLVNEQETAGACIKFLRDQILYPLDAFNNEPPTDDFYTRLNAAAAGAPPGSGRLIFTPWLYGERTPVENPTVRGGFHNLSLGATRSHVVRAVLEGVAYNSRWLLECVENYTGRPFAHLNFIGGGANSSLWCQIMADVLDRRIRQVRNPIEANARGAAFLGAVAMGWMTWDDVAARIEIEGTFDPNPANRAIYDQLYGEFRNIYKRNKGIYARLNKQHE